MATFHETVFIYKGENKVKQKLHWVCLVSILAGCGGPQDANEKNFKVALNKGFETGLIDNEACIRLVINGTSHNRGDIDALVNAGFMTKSPNLAWNVVDHDLTSEGLKYFNIERSLGAKWATGCYANMAVGEIKNFTQPSDFGGVTYSDVSFTYKLTNVAPWSKEASVQQAFPGIKKLVENESKQELKRGLVLTNNGWEVLTNK